MWYRSKMWWKHFRFNKLPLMTQQWVIMNGLLMKQTKKHCGKMWKIDIWDSTFIFGVMLLPGASRRCWLIRLTEFSSSLSVWLTSNINLYSSHPYFTPGYVFLFLASSVLTSQNKNKITKFRPNFNPAGYKQIIYRSQDSTNEPHLPQSQTYIHTNPTCQ